MKKEDLENELLELKYALSAKEVELSRLKDSMTKARIKLIQVHWFTSRSKIKSLIDDAKDFLE